MTQPDLFQSERPEPYDFTVSFGDPPGLLEAMGREGIAPRMMDVLRGRYRLRGTAQPSTLARVLQETGAKPEHLQPKTTQRPRTPNMKTTSTELRPIANNATAALAGLIPFTHGSGRDSHGNPVPHGDRVIADALHRMVQAGRDAERILAQVEVQR